ncbi:uncharacterized protein LOC115191841 isoform X2 [Salmo trutta]|uniref:uncharacterized protein LOC115191841 isoform X2 n=1 Tax=Salmo trutta TaxID=8032 RepID=UPI0011322BDA|nr:uncharacterized protein LOC115191841 isoform X2 [Salmo trutta]
MIRSNMGTPNQPCDSGVSMDLFLHYSLILSFVIVVVLSALQRRSRHLPIDEKLPFLNNRFGIVVVCVPRGCSRGGPGLFPFLCMSVNPSPRVRGCSGNPLLFDMVNHHTVGYSDVSHR